WESRSVPFFTRKPLLETVKGFFRLQTSQKVPESNGTATKPHRDKSPKLYYKIRFCRVLI
ncbi:MAG: hypothetical protein ACN6PN_11545, partial [Sphingobacterium sp.]